MNVYEMKHLFTYGTLMFKEVWSLVVRRDYQSQSGTLSGFIRKSVRGAEYPVIYPAPGVLPLQGVVYFDVTAADIDLLDAFEGDYYDRQHHKIVLPDQRIVEAEVYVLKDQYHDIATEKEWDPSYFRQQGMKKFVKSYGGFPDTHHSLP
jgi:gamma-glutamylcyclotransferase (GGCT)/AIG2-like uncharacterized protein YtfP